MTDNIVIGPEANLNYTLQVLRDGQTSGEIAADTGIQPGLALHIDPELQPGGRWTSPAGRLLELDLVAQAKGNWVGLHLELGHIDLSRAGIIGLACRSAAPSMEAIRPCIRSRHPGSPPDGPFDDCFFEKRILAHSRPSSHLDALSISAQPRLPVENTRRELIFFLPQRSFRWDLHDLRLFIV